MTNQYPDEFNKFEEIPVPEEISVTPEKLSHKLPPRVGSRIGRRIQNLMKRFADRDKICADPACVNRECIESRNKNVKEVEYFESAQND